MCTALQKNAVGIRDPGIKSLMPTVMSHAIKSQIYLLIISIAGKCVKVNNHILPREVGLTMYEQGWCVRSELAHYV